MPKYKVCPMTWNCPVAAITIECPNCAKNISLLSSDGSQQVLVTLRNEGGVQERYDILPAATEEAYLRAYPEERKGHAYLEFCREGDIDAIIHMIKDSDEDDEQDDRNTGDILRYRGTFEGIEGSGLHVAIRYNQQEVAWLLLALGSQLDWAKFPSVVLQAMEGLGLRPEDRKGEPDIRTLIDSEGRTPAALARELKGVWTEWLKEDRLNP
ncbi:putative ring finger-like protein [Fonsecaea pedrosoi]|nr:putative ring finger-like protein [Fonsecaea pedrosoi]